MGKSDIKTSINTCWVLFLICTFVEWWFNQKLNRLLKERSFYGYVKNIYRAMAVSIIRSRHLSQINLNFNYKPLDLSMVIMRIYSIVQSCAPNIFMTPRRYEYLIIFIVSQKEVLNYHYKILSPNTLEVIDLSTVSKLGIQPTIDFKKCFS